MSRVQQRPFPGLRKLCVGLGLCAAISSSAWSLEAYDRLNHRRVEIISLVGGDSFGVGSLLELGLDDTQEIITGEILTLRRIGHDIEVEILDRSSNHHFFIEFPEDGMTEIHR